MYWKELRSYFEECAIFLMITGLLLLALWLTKGLVIAWSFFSVLLILPAVWILQYGFGFVGFTLLVASDFLKRDYCAIQATYVEQFEFKSSTFRDKKEDKKLRYKMIVCVNGETWVLTSAKDFNLKPDVTYSILIGKKSKTVINVSEESV